MPERNSRVAFCLVLPITQLLVSVVVLWPMRNYLMIEILRRPPIVGKGRVQHFPAVQAPVPNITLEQLENRRETVNRIEIPAALNLPVMLTQLPYAIHNQSKTEWKPAGMDFQDWRAISWPVVGVLFWWLAGRGINAMLAIRQKLLRPQLQWVEVTVAVVIFIFTSLVVIAALEEHFRDRTMIVFSAGAALWMLLTGVTLTARVLQWRIQRQQRTASSVAAPVTC